MSRLIKLLQTLSLTALGRVLGYLRDVALAAAFGTSAIAELFIYGFRLQLFLRTLLADQPIPALLVPHLSRAGGAEGEGEAEAEAILFRQARRYAAGLGLALVLLLVVSQPLLISTMAPGLVTDTTGLDNPWILASLVGIGASISLLFSFTSTVGIALLQYRERYRAAALVPVMFNIVLIITLLAGLFLNALEGIGQALLFAVGLLSAGLVQSLVAKALLKRDPAAVGALGRPKLTPIKRPLAQSYVSVSVLKLFEPLPLIIVSAFASVNAGYFAGLYFAERLTMLGPSILGLVAGAMLLTNLSRKIAAKNVSAALGDYWRALALVFLAAAAGAIVLAFIKAPVVEVLFARGAFDAEATELVTSFLGPLIWLIPFAAIEYVTLQVFVTSERTRFALIIGIFSVIATVLMSWNADSAAAYAWAFAAPSIARSALSVPLAWFALKSLR